jgi:DNA-binding XRE family transcriptional regulator
MESPAEQLARTKVRRVRKVQPKRDAVWVCALSDYRQRLGLTIADVATAVGMSDSGYWLIERGGDTALTTAWRLAEFFGTPIEALWHRRAGEAT